MGDEASDSDDFDWDLQSSRVRSADKIPIPEENRDQITIDSESDPATWWGYDKDTGYAFLSSGYTNGDRYLTVNNRTYKLEKGSRVSIPKPSEDGVTEGVLGERPEEGDTVYFYTDSRMLNREPKTVFVLSKDQIDLVLRDYETSLFNMDFVEDDYDTGGLVSTESYSDDDDGGESSDSWERTRSVQTEEEMLKEAFPLPR